MNEDIFRAKLLADEGTKGLFESDAENSVEYAQQLKSEIAELKEKLKRLQASYKVYREFGKMGLRTWEDVAQATYEAALEEAKEGRDDIVLPLLLDAAKNGLVKARLELAKAYVFGKFGVKAAPEKGLAILREEAEKGEAEACLLLTVLHDGFPTLVGPDEALEMCQKAASMGYQPAMDRLEQPFDMSEETKRLLSRLEKGEKGVRFWLSTRGDLPAKEREKHFFDAVKEGDPMAEYEMGATLLREDDEKGAKEYFQRAADHGNGAACFALIDLILDGRPHYYKGRKLPSKDDPVYQQELALVRQAAEIGDNRGLVVLGRSYVRGYMVDKDYEQAKPLLEKALSQGEMDAAPQMLGEIYANTEGEGNATKAVEYYELSASHGNVASMVALQRIFENGLREVKKDNGKATYYSLLSGGGVW
ncbi:MAG: hypothetical protein K6E59_05180 [Bacilli bacterium]|nr:hypothetical protein [Bacilli bacterium]